MLQIKKKDSGGFEVNFGANVVHAENGREVTKAVSHYFGLSKAHESLNVTGCPLCQRVIRNACIKGRKT
jgi:hypothetical protein